MTSFDSLVTLSGLSVVVVMLAIGFGWQHYKEVKRSNGTATRYH